MTLGKAGMQIQVLGPGLTQMPAPQPPAPVQTQVKESPLHVSEVSKNRPLIFKLQHEGHLFVHVTDSNNEDAFQCRAQQRSQVCAASILTARFNCLMMTFI